MPRNPLGPVCTAATIHMGAAVANFAWLETRSSPADLYGSVQNAEIFVRKPELDGATYPVDDALGLGIEIDDERTRAQSFKFWEAPHLKRCDGSVTIW